VAGFNLPLLRFGCGSLKVDVVFDTIGEDTQVRSFKVLKRGGGLVSAVCEPPEDTCKRQGVRCAMVAVQPNVDQLVEISALIDSGQLSPTIATTMPLEKARQAHEMSQSGHTRGKIILTI
jgi:NADPH:quinone reductase-like Zn-dependent oxidoreductase